MSATQDPLQRQTQRTTVGSEPFIGKFMLCRRSASLYASQDEAFAVLRSRSATLRHHTAKMAFIGNRDVSGDQLVFMSRVKGNIANPDVEIGFGGTFKGVTFGFAYFSDKDGTNLAFNIKGQHTWNSTAASWNVSLGYTQKTFKASLAGRFIRRAPTDESSL